jgi:hypothetical protein
VRSETISRRVTFGVSYAVCIFFVAYGIATAWHSASGLPTTYSRLRAHGVSATATFAGCSGNLRLRNCRLALAFRGHTRRWRYPEDYGQFDRLHLGAPVAVLVEPRHPSTVYTVHDVDVRYDAGFSASTVFGVVLAGAGFLGLACLLLLRRLARVARSRLSGNA